MSALVVLAVLLAAAPPAMAASPDGSQGDRACQSLEEHRFVLRHAPLSPASDPASVRGQIVCPAAAVMKALAEGKPVELENVVLKGRLALGEVAPAVLQADLPFVRDQQRRRLDTWLEGRRREHRAPNVLPGEARFRLIGVPISIRDSRIETVDGGAGDPLFFTESLDLRGTEINGSLGLPGAIFREPVGLDGVRISGWVALTAAHFDAGLDFSRTQVGGPVRFDGATFGARALSRPSRDRQVLAETPALFTAATFAGAVSFRDAVFQSPADYQKATFAREADFTAARFRQRVDFGHARFAGLLDAANAVFEEDARFPGTRFEQAASFRRAEFRWRADFGLATFSDAGSTFREAEFGPSLARLLAKSSPASPRTWPRLLVGEEQTGYDFRNTTFTDRARALARSEFEIHQVFALVTVLSALVGLLVGFALRQRPLLRWWPEGGVGAVARVSDARPSRAGTVVMTVLAMLRRWMAAVIDRAPVRVKESMARTGAVTDAVTRPFSTVRASPREQLTDAAFMLAAYALLAVGLAVHYQSHAGSAVDLWVGFVYPVLGLVAWLGGLASARVAIGFRARRLRAAERPGKPGPPWLDYFEPGYHGPRRCDEFVGAFARRVSTGVLGLAGLPGAGRSWLARAVLEGRVALHEGVAEQHSVVAVSASSPPSGDLLPFFTTLFRRVALEARQKLRRSVFTVDAACRHVDAAEELIESPRAVALVPLGVVLAAMAAIFTLPWRPPHGSEALDWSAAAVLRVMAHLTPLLLLLSIVLFAGTYYVRLWSRRNLRKALQTCAAGRLYIATERVLERLAYEEATSVEQGASVAMQGVGLQRRRSRALKERPVTLAAVLADFQSYIEDLRVVYAGGVVVHIDDADRIDDLASVRELLLRLKATLMGGVMYLVPLPQSVAVGRRLRTTGMAGAVAGMLDDLVVVEPMTTLEGLRMLARRDFFREPRDGLGLAMCLLSGGVAKEILRLLRRVSTEGGGWTVERLVERTWQDARDGVADVVRRSDLAPALVQPILLSLDSLTSSSQDDAAWSQCHAHARAAARSARPGGKPPRVEMIEALTYLAERRRAITELRRQLEALSTWERELLDNKNLPGDEPWDSPAELEKVGALEKVRRAFLAGSAGVST